MSTSDPIQKAEADLFEEFARAELIAADVACFEWHDDGETPMVRFHDERIGGGGSVYLEGEWHTWLGARGLLPRSDRWTFTRPPALRGPDGAANAVGEVDPGGRTYAPAPLVDALVSAACALADQDRLCSEDDETDEAYTLKVQSDWERLCLDLYEKVWKMRMEDSHGSD